MKTEELKLETKLLKHLESKTRKLENIEIEALKRLKQTKALL